MKGRIFLGVLLAAAVVFSGCQSKKTVVSKDYGRMLPPGQNALRKITDPAQIPDFTFACSDLTNLQNAVANSLNYMNKPSSKGFFPSNDITHEHAKASLETFLEMLDSGLSGFALNSAIREKFDVYISVGCDDMGTVLFTGYYTPILNGSMERTDRFKYPLYKQPADLVKAEDGKILGRKLADGSIQPYPVRAVIDGAQLGAGNELIWLEDEFENYVAHIQGSAKIRLPDGSIVGVGYAATNGYDYKSPWGDVVAQGLMTKQQASSLDNMIAFFKQRPDLIKPVTYMNPRYVFFRFEDGNPRGSINEPVIEMRSIATDKTIFPRASVTFISTSLPREYGGVISSSEYTGFTCDQDTGGAIRAPGRCDVYMGIGEMAGRLAGQTYQEGKLYYLFLKQ